MEVSIFEVLFFLTLLVYTAPHIMVFGAVYGGLSTQECMKKLPPNSFINVRNFRSPKQLANYLLYLDKNDTAYMAYHAWRLDYELVSPDHLCRICKALHNSSMTKPRNVDFGQFWNTQKDCDSNLIHKVIN